MAGRNSVVEIGYLDQSPPHRLQSRFFPSKVGGKPAWLNLEHISIDLSCGKCQKPCIFLCQIYAPIDEERAYHRTIFVFVCKNPECCQENASDNFKVFRCQLPRKNKYYVPEEPEDKVEWHPESAVENFTSVCFVCGCWGDFHCKKCKSQYCSEEHMKLDRGEAHKNCENNPVNVTHHKILFPEYEILTETEDTNDSDEDEPEKTEKSDEDKMKEYQTLLKEGKGGTLPNELLEIVEEMALGEEDEYLKIYKAKLKLFPEQVVRYSRGGQPLWVAQPNYTENDIPYCQYCRRPREFELQILSTLLSYLNVDSLEKSIDWGSLLIYTCKNNCDEGPAYKEEYLVKQDIL